MSFHVDFVLSTESCWREETKEGKKEETAGRRTDGETLLIDPIHTPEGETRERATVNTYLLRFQDLLCIAFKHQPNYAINVITIILLWSEFL